MENNIDKPVADQGKKKYTIEEYLVLEAGSDIKHEYFQGEIRELHELHEAAVSYDKRKYTIEEYLALEEVSEIKHEYYQGEIFAMSGGTVTHNVISGNLYSTLRNRLKGKGCRPFGSDLRIYSPENTLFTYPDLSIICDEIKTLNNDNLNVLNPTVIIEVLSPSTRNYDMGQKFSFYRSIPSLKEYIVVDSTAIGASASHINASNHWELQDYKDPNSSLIVHALNLSIPFKDIYEKSGLF